MTIHNYLSIKIYIYKILTIELMSKFYTVTINNTNLKKLKMIDAIKNNMDVSQNTNKNE